MHSILDFAGVLIALFVVLQLMQIILVASRMIKLPLWRPLTIPIRRSAVEDVLPVLDTAQAELLRNGFRHMHTRRTRSLVAAPGVPPMFCDVYLHPQHDVHAEVYVTEVPTPERLCDIYLWNTFVDGSSLLTVNGRKHLLIPYPRSVTVADGHASDFSAHLAFHLAQRQRIDKVRTDPADALEMAKALNEQLLPQLEKEKHVNRRGGPDGDPVYGLRPLTALGMAWRLRLAAMRPKRKSAPATETAQAWASAQAAAERVAFVRTLCMLRGMRAPRWFGRATLLCSAIVFLAVGVWWWGVAAAVTIAAVLLVHEAGHWMAMKRAGFRDVQVFFVPGMGAATSGEKHDASPMTHLLVYLAGPFPGLVLALATYAWVALLPGTPEVSWHPLVASAALVAFFINAVNLLPVLPFDGGRVIELFLVGRLPWLRFLFAASSGVMLLAGGWVSGDSVLRVIGIIMLVGSHHHYRIAKASAKLLREQETRPPVDAGFAVAACQVHDFLAQADFQKWPYKTRLLVGQALLPRFRVRLPDWKESALALSIYSSCALLPLAALVGLVLAAPERMLPAIGQGVSVVYGGDRAKADAPGPANASARPVETEVANMLQSYRAQRAASLAAAADPAQRLAALKKGIEDARDFNDHDDALRLARMFHEDAGKTAAGSRERAEANLSLAAALDTKYGQAGSRGDEIRKLQQEAEAILRQRIADKMHIDEALLLAQLLEERIYGHDDATILSMRQEIVALLAANMTPSDYRLANPRRNLAHALDKLGQANAAETQMRQAVSDLGKSSDAMAISMIENLKRDMAWLFIAHRKLDEAIGIAEQTLATTKAETESASIERRHARMLLAMAARLKGDWPGVKKHAEANREIRQTKTGSWLVDLYIGSQPPIRDRRATLMLIDAERALGNNAAADKLVAELRQPYLSANPAATSKIMCSMHVFDTGWQRDFLQTLADIEQRELKCTSAAHLAIPATSRIPSVAPH